MVICSERFFFFRFFFYCCIPGPSNCGLDVEFTLPFVNRWELNVSLVSPATHGSVFPPDGKNRQGAEDDVTDTVHVTRHYRPADGECGRVSQ